MLSKWFGVPKRFLAASFIFLLLCAAFYITFSAVTFPGAIRVVAGRESRFNFGLPFIATVGVSDGSDAVTVVNTSDAPVRDNIIIDLSSEVAVYASQTATADITLTFLGIPVKNVQLDVLPDLEVIPCGLTAGIQIDTTGVMVLGTGAVTDADGQSTRPCEGKVKSGDIILKINGQDVDSQEQFNRAVEASKPGAEVRLSIKRGNTNLEIFIVPAVSREDGKNRLGLWVRDSTKGIGTITYYNPETRSFGALGHGIADVDTKQIIPVKNGAMYEINIVTVKKGKAGSPGELVGEVNKNAVIGTITSNTPLGLFGKLSGSAELPNGKMRIALQGDVCEGPAVILSNVMGRETRSYDVYIERVNRYSADDARGMVIRVTDQELITRTNGIVQGMSGSPVIQNGRIVGAITHVFVQNPLKGYGIFIENMIKQERGG